MPALMKGEAVYVGGFTRNGIISWSEAVAARFSDFGGELRLGTRLKSIEVEGGNVTGVKLEGDDGEEFIPTRRVVFNIPVQELFKYVSEEAFPADFAAGIKSLYGYGSLTPYIGPLGPAGPGRPCQAAHEDPLRGAAQSEGFDWDVYMAWNIQSYIEPSCAPAGQAPLHRVSSPHRGRVPRP